MLLRFSVRNYRSLAAEQEILLTASGLSDDTNGLISVEGLTQGVLPVIAMYGPNASGKSNLLKAISFFVDGVRGSYKKPPGPINRRPFRLSKHEQSDSTSMELDFVVRDFRIGNLTSNVRFTYGFKITDDSVEEEWLYAYPMGHRQVWFHRNKNESPEYYFGRALKGQNRIISGLTRSDVLFLSMAYVNNHTQLTPIFEFLTSGILIRLDNLSFDEKSPLVRFLENDTLREHVLGFLQNADTGICAAEVSEEDVSGKSAEIYEDLSVLVGKHFPDDKDFLNKQIGDRFKRKKVKLGHTGEEGIVYFELEDESRGTLAFLELIGMVLLALEKGAVLVVDEFDSSLHPVLSKQVIQLFNSRETNPNGAQLLFSTHDVSIISKDILRRDQIYFVEKDTHGMSTIYPLISLKTKKVDNIQKGYLEGRYGAIPFLGDFGSLVGVKGDEKVSKNKIA